MIPGKDTASSRPPEKIYELAAVTATVAVPLTPFTVAVIVAEPAATPVTSPPEFTVAVVVADDDQLTAVVTTPVVPFA
jgi:hypothetical protein